MTAFDKAREIVKAYGDREHMPELPPSKRAALAVARALLAYEPTPDARGVATAILATIAVGCAFEPCTIPPCGCADEIAAAITRATAASEARGRELEAALTETHAVLVMLTEPDAIKQTNAMQAWAQAVEAELEARRALGGAK